jgi:nucleoid-associated protein YgaU
MNVMTASITASSNASLFHTNPLVDRRRAAAASVDRRTDLASPGESGPHGPATRRLSESVYLRRRVVLGVALLLVAVALVVSIGSVTTAGADRGDGPPAVSAEGESYVVQPGDTLWSIAEQLAPDADRRAVVDALNEVSGGASLQPGQRLYLPGSLSGG